MKGKMSHLVAERQNSLANLIDQSLTVYELQCVRGGDGGSSGGTIVPDPPIIKDDD